MKYLDYDTKNISYLSGKSVTVSPRKLEFRLSQLEDLSIFSRKCCRTRHVPQCIISRRIFKESFPSMIKLRKLGMVDTEFGSLLNK